MIRSKIHIFGENTTEVVCFSQGVIRVLYIMFYSTGGSFAKLCPTLVTLWTVACQALLSMGFSRQEY